MIFKCTYPALQSILQQKIPQFLSFFVTWSLEILVYVNITVLHEGILDAAHAKEHQKYLATNHLSWTPKIVDKKVVLPVTWICLRSPHRVHSHLAKSVDERSCHVVWQPLFSQGKFLLDGLKYKTCILIFAFFTWMVFIWLSSPKVTFSWIPFIA